MIVSSGYRKNGFDAHGGKLLQKKDMDFWNQQREDEWICRTEKNRFSGFSETGDCI